MDVHSPQQRSYNMSKIRGKNTKPEMVVRKWLWSEGYRYRLHKKNLPGTPDIVFSSHKKVIFIHGCFWHKHNCKYFKWPETNKEFWREKINRNIQRDKENCKRLKSIGWNFLILWECELLHCQESSWKEKVKLFLEEK